MTSRGGNAPVATVFAAAKLTLSLRIVGVRNDGMHLIDAEMVSLDLADRLEISQADVSDVQFIGPAAGALGGAASTDNLVTRALRLAERHASVRVLKAIPPGAGLGGGSSDAAAILRWAGFNDVVAAADLGADVSFCLVGGRARVRGIGEVVDSLPVETRTYTLLTPPIHCSTPVVYRRWDEMGGPIDPEPSGNDLAAAAVDAYPDLIRWRDELAEASGRMPKLAGSGSTWFVEGDVGGPGRVVTTTTGALGT